MMKRILFPLIFAVGATFSASASYEMYDFDSPAQEAVFHKLGSELRCPKCQNNNIADSNSGLAQDLRMKVYDMLKQGKNEDQVVDYMIARYGNFVTYNPPVTASTVILWAGPALFVIGGFFVLVMRSRKSKTRKNVATLDSDEQSRLAALLDEKWVEKNNKDNNG